MRDLFSAEQPSRGVAPRQLCYLCDATGDTDNVPKRTLLLLANRMWYGMRLSVRTGILMEHITSALFHQSRGTVCLTPLKVFYHFTICVTDPVTDSIIMNMDMRAARNTLVMRLMELDPVTNEPVGVDGERLSKLERVMRLMVATHPQLRCGGHGAGGGASGGGPGTLSGPGTGR